MEAEEEFQPHYCLQRWSVAQGPPEAESSHWLIASKEMGTWVPWLLGMGFSQQGERVWRHILPHSLRTEPSQANNFQD